MKRVLFSFGKLSAASVLAKGRIVFSGMNGNDYFPDANPSMANFLEKLDSLETSITNAKKGGAEAKAIKNQLLKEVKDDLRTLAMYVNSVSNGDMVKMVSSGFTVEKDRTPVALETPVITAITQAQNPGAMGIKIKVKGASSLLYQCAVDNGEGDLAWQVFGDTKKTFQFTNLEQGKKYWFKVVAIGSKNQQAVSDEVAQYVLQRSMK